MGDRTDSPGQIITLPRGGGALSGMGEKFEPDLFTGTGHFTVPIRLPPGRNGHQPELSLTYSSGYGQGPFGLGWSVSLPEVARRTAAGVPRYDETDVFMLSGADDLVPLAPDPTPGVARFRPRTETLFERIERCRRGADDYWQVTDRSGTVATYGTPGRAGADDATVADPKGRSRVFAWKLTSLVDSFGNRIRYEYAPHAEHLTGQGRWDQSYLTAIRYADYGDPDHPQFLVNVEFVYEPVPYLRGAGGPRAEVSSYNAGFEIRTVQRCVRIEVYAQPGKKVPVSTCHLRYAQSAAGASLLTEVQVEGHDGDKSEQMPPLRFDYSAFNPEQRQFFPLTGADRPAEGLNSPVCELADLFGRGLPDIVEWGGRLRYWRNLGDGRLDRPREIGTVPAGLSLADPDVQLLDANGDGRIDLLVNSPAMCGYYPMAPEGAWDRRSFRALPAAPGFALKDPLVRLVDLDGDGVTDAIRSGAGGLECFFLHPTEGWKAGPVLPYRGLDQFPAVSFADPRVQFADMTGDGLQEPVLVDSGQVAYWPSLGYGRFGPRVQMWNSPRFPHGFDPERVLLGDVDGDGAADLVYVENGRITVWLNQCGRAWSDPVVINGTPPVTNAHAVRLADMLGHGTAGVLWSEGARSDRRDSLFYFDFTGGQKPYLLSQVDNNIGAVTQIAYASSTRWHNELPFPVQVVAAVKSIDRFTGNSLTTTFRYHHGYWDGVEREFRGFGRVDEFDAPAPDRPGAPAPVETRTWFHLGQPDTYPFAHEYWPGDPPYVGAAVLPDGLDPGARREAARSLRGSLLRTEVYIRDGSDRQDRPHSVTEHGYSVVVKVPPAAGRAGVFFPCPRAERQTEWERGDDPQTNITYTDDYDEYGQPRKELEIGVPRHRSYREAAAPGEPYLVSLTCTEYARPDGNVPIVDCEARETTWEIVNDGALAAHTLHTEVMADRLPRQRIAETCCYYDGAAFEGRPCGQVGPYGALTRTESLAFTPDLLREAFGQIPPYLVPGGTAPWTDEYPPEFRTALPELAGYIWRDGAYWTPDEQYAYDFQRGRPARGRKLEYRTPTGGVTSAEYDSFDMFPASVTDPAGNAERVTYDYRVMEPAEYVDANGNRTALAYTPLGLPAALTAAGKAGEAAGDTLEVPGIRWVYDWHAPISVRTIRREHAAGEPDVPPEERDRTLETAEYSDGFGRVLQTRCSGAAVRFGDPVFGEGLLPPDQAQPVGPSAGSRCPEGAPHWVVVTGQQVYDVKGRVVAAYEPFWSAGWEYSAPTAAQTGRCVTMHYDPLGRLVRTVQPNGSEQRIVFGIPSVLTDPGRYAPTPWETYTYDDNDNGGRTHPERALLYKYQWNTPASTRVDAHDRVVEQVERMTTDPGGRYCTTYAYNIAGDLLLVTDALQYPAERTLYDLQHRPLRVVRLSAGTVLTVPVAGGEVVEERDSKGALTLRAYDRLERMAAVWARDGFGQPVTLRERFVYGDSPESGLTREQAQARNLLGRLFRQQDGAGVLTREQYDRHGHLIEKARVVAGREYRISHRFDEIGRIRSVLFPADAAGRRQLLKPVYDGGGQLERLLLEGRPVIERIAYNARGERTLIARANGMMTRFLHEPDTDRLLRRRSEAFAVEAGLIYLPRPLPPVDDTLFEYDLLGHPLAMKHRFPDCGLPEHRHMLDRDFRYDPLYRIGLATGRECAAPGEAPWDAGARPGDAARAAKYCEVYLFDPTDNLVRSEHIAGGVTTVREYRLRAGTNQLEAMVDRGTVYPYQYDPSGNLIREAGARRFTFDHLNRISEFRHQAEGTAPAVTVQYRYDAAGIRVLKQVSHPDGSTATTVSIDGAFEQHRLERPGSPAAEYSLLHVRNGSERIALVRVGDPFPGDQGPAVQYLLSDHLGSSTLVTDGDGQWLNREEYLPFGGTSFGSFTGKRFRFSGKERDVENGLSYFGARYFAPHLGRWMSSDSIGCEDGLNLYAYVGGNPLAYMDPGGFARKKGNGSRRSGGGIKKQRTVKPLRFKRPGWSGKAKGLIDAFKALEKRAQKQTGKKPTKGKLDRRHILDNLTLEQFSVAAATHGVVAEKEAKKAYNTMFVHPNNLWVGGAKHNQGMGSTTPRLRKLIVKMQNTPSLTTRILEQRVLKTADKRIRETVREFIPVMHTMSVQDALAFVSDMERNMTFDLPQESNPKKVAKLLQTNEKMRNFIKDPKAFGQNGFRQIVDEFLSVK